MPTRSSERGTLAKLRSELSPVTLLSSLIAGLIVGIVAVTVAVAFATFIFSGELSNYLAAGIGIMFFATIAVAGLTALTSALRGIVVGLQDSAIAILSIVAATIVRQMPPSAAPEEIFLTVVVAIAMSSLLTGMVFLLLGKFRLGNLVRYIPYPVMGGFLAGTGLLLVRGAIGMMTKAPLGPSLTQPSLLTMWLPGLAFAILLAVILRRSDHFLIIPGMLLGGIAIFFVVLWATGTTIAEATAQGWLIESLPTGGLWHPLMPSDLSRVNWVVLGSQSGNLAAIALVSVLNLLLNAAGFELATGQDVDLNHELKAAGLSNLISGLGGGMVGYHALSDSVLAHRMGARGRLVGVFLAILCGIVLATGSLILSLLPYPILGGLMLFLGLDFLLVWLYDSWFQLPKSDYVVVVLILVVINVVGFLEGIGVGVALAIIIFVVDYSRVNVVRQQLSGALYHSSVERPLLYRRLLERKGNWLHLYKLQGFVFFGTGNGLLKEVRARAYASERPELRFVVFDFKLVTGLDTSSAFSFAKIKQLAENEGFALVFTGLSPEMHRQLERVVLADGVVHVFSDIDHGMEWCEEQMIAIFNEVGLAARPQTLKALLERSLPESVDVTILEQYLRPVDVREGDVVVHEGEKDIGMFFVENVRVTVQLVQKDGATTRLRTMDCGTIVGEIGTYLGMPTTASVVAEEDGVLYHLSAEMLRRMETKEPQLAMAFHRFMAELLAERVASTTAMMEALL